MKNSIITTSLFLAISVSLYSQQPWQKISDPSAKEVAEGFKSPPPEYGMILWWGWYGPMSDTVIKRDFDFVDEQALTTLLKTENGGLRNLSGQSYRTIIVPSISVIPNASLAKLKEFSVSGGKMIFVGNLPSLAVENNFMNAVKPIDLSWALHEETGKLTEVTMQLLPTPDLKTDRTLPQLKYTHRQWKDADLYFIFNENKESVSFNVSFREKGKKQI